MKRKRSQSNKDGFVLVASLLILLVLTIMGVAVNRNTTTEWQIAMNDRLHKETFYSADAAAELSAEIIEQCYANCPGYTDNDTNTVKVIHGDNGYDIGVISSLFWMNYANTDDKTLLVDIPSDDNRDLVFPAIFNTLKTTGFDIEATNSQPHANINIGGNSGLSKGSAIQMAAGYEGLGKGLASGHGITYDIKVQQIGKDGSISVICTKYFRKSKDTTGDPCIIRDK